MVLASGAMACGSLLGLGAEEDDAPDTTAAADASSELQAEAPSIEGDSTVSVDPPDHDGGASDAGDAGVKDAATGPSGCQGDAGCVRYVFVTSTEHVGTLLGLSGADTICKTRRGSNPLLANRTFVAWISTQAKDARDRFVATAPIRRVDGVQIATSLADLLQNGPAAAIDVDENGNVITNTTAVFTGTQNNGMVNNNCLDWTDGNSPAKVGSALATKSGLWTDNATKNCSDKARIYCFEY